MHIFDGEGYAYGIESENVEYVSVSSNDWHWAHIEHIELEYYAHQTHRPSCLSTAWLRQTGGGGATRASLSGFSLTSLRVTAPGNSIFFGHLELQSRFGGKPLKIEVICPQLSTKQDCSPKRVQIFVFNTRIHTLP